MPYLLDTHTFLWFLDGNEQLPKKIIKKLSDINEPCFISIASFWEIAIKKQIGKLHLDISLEQLFRFAERNQIEVVAINENHLLTLIDLDFPHQDPFDRIIISQAISENLILLSKDKKMSHYKVKLEW